METNIYIILIYEISLSSFRSSLRLIISTFRENVINVENFGLAFLPIHMFVMTPIMEVELIITDISDFDLKEQEALAILLFNSDKIYYHAFILHVIFGAIMGLMAGFILNEDYSKVERIGKFW